MDTLLLGKRNPRLTDIRKAIARGGLTSDGFLPIEGWKLVMEAHTSGVEISALFLRSDAATHESPRGVPAFTLEPAVFRSIQSTETSQGVVALVRLPQFSLQQLIDARPAPIVILAGLQDPGNVGTILRVAESFGAAGCIGLRGTASMTNSKTVRASAGSVFRLPCLWDQSLSGVTAELKAAGITLVGTSPHAAEPIHVWDWRKPSAILVGTEGAGLAEDFVRVCDRMVTIPHQQRVESLNSAVAAAIVLYEAFKQRGIS